VPGSVEEAEALFHDLARRPGWVDGFARVASLQGDWPRAGAVLTWDSRPGGRGRVRERVVSLEPGAGQRTEVEDERLEGTQDVAFSPRPGGVQVTWVLDYRLKERTPVTPLVDLLFVRRALTASLRRSLARFARERAADAELQGGR
jgi:hypothetical protein